MLPQHRQDAVTALRYSSVGIALDGIPQPNCVTQPLQAVAGRRAVTGPSIIVHLHGWFS